MGDDDGSGKRRPYSYSDWRRDGFRGRPPWRRGYKPGYLLLSVALFAILLAVIVVATSR